VVSHCPGQDSRNLKVAVYKCPTCESEVEIFSDETRIRCRKCGKYVYRDKTPSCIDWCSQARECIGEERWKQIKDPDARMKDIIPEV
jgi:DNA-directed RNA polymerase subunit RPC12/RpoP